MKCWVKTATVILSGSSCAVHVEWTTRKLAPFSTRVPPPTVSHHDGFQDLVVRPTPTGNNQLQSNEMEAYISKEYQCSKSSTCQLKDNQWLTGSPNYWSNSFGWLVLIIGFTRSNMVKSSKPQNEGGISFALLGPNQTNRTHASSTYFWYWISLFGYTNISRDS